MIYLLFITIILAGIAEAIMDTILFHFYESPFKNRNHFFWNPNLSWRNKYKDGIADNGAKFFLSTTLLVSFTDGWHLMKLIRTSMLFTSIGILLFLVKDGVGVDIGMVIVPIILMTIFKLSFTLFYKLFKETKL